MTEYRLISFAWRTEKLIAVLDGQVRINTLDFAQSVPELAEHMDGWEPVSFQIIPLGELTNLVILLKTQITVPDGA